MKRKTVNLTKLTREDISTEDLWAVVESLLHVAWARSQSDLENDIEAGLDSWERNERLRRDALSKAINLLSSVPNRGGQPEVTPPTAGVEVREMRNRM